MEFGRTLLNLAEAIEETRIRIAEFFILIVKCSEDFGPDGRKVPKWGNFSGCNRGTQRTRR